MEELGLLAVLGSKSEVADLEAYAALRNVDLGKVRRRGPACAIGRFCRRACPCATPPPAPFHLRGARHARVPGRTRRATHSPAITAVSATGGAGAARQGVADAGQRLCTGPRCDAVSIVSEGPCARGTLTAPRGRRGHGVAPRADKHGPNLVRLDRTDSEPHHAGSRGRHGQPHSSQGARRQRHCRLCQ